ncbi:MAG: hypothetical protein CMF11_04905 [Idiomarina sp.]|nr:hypothetical protein [Idiomarina sp.]
MSYNLFPSQITPPSVETSSLSVKGEVSYDTTVWSSAAGLWGTPVTRISELNDALYRSDIRYAPNATLGLCPDTSNLHHHLFDGDFDTYVNIPDGQATEMVIDNFGTVSNGGGIIRGFVYPQGEMFVVFYFTDHHASLDVKIEVTRWNADPVIRDTYVEMTSSGNVSRDSRYLIYKFDIPKDNYVRRMKLTIDAPAGTGPIRLSGWHYFMDRFFINDVEPPYVSKYSRRNTLNGQLVIRDGTDTRPGIAFASSLYDPSSLDTDFGRGKFSAGIRRVDTSGQQRIAVTSAKTEALTITDTGNSTGEGLVGINQTTPSATLDIGGNLGIAQGAAPADPPSGKSAIWMDSASGDLKIKINFGGVVKTFTLADYSA